MALDRQSIEKKDFPIARRGYDPEAVDSHLARLAAEVDRLQREPGGAPRDGAAGGRPASLALAASEQVRSIVEAAESSAAEIERAAEQEAARIRSEATADAQRTRDDAVARSKEHVGNVNESASLMLKRVDAMEGELGTLVESLHTGTNRLTADLSLLQSNMGELYGASGGSAPPAAVAAPTTRAAEAAEATSRPQPAQPDDAPGAGSEAPEQDLAASQPAAVPSTPAAAPPTPAAPQPPPATEPEPAAAGAGGPGPRDGGDVEGARLIALNMALNGQPREETDRYLAENFDLADRATLLDEVYATVGG